MTGLIISVCTVATAVVAVVSFAIGNTRQESKARGRIYERIDEHKDYSESTFVRKDVCAIINKQVSIDLTEIKSDIKKLLSKNGIK